MGERRQHTKWLPGLEPQPAHQPPCLVWGCPLLWWTGPLHQWVPGLELQQARQPPYLVLEPQYQWYAELGPQRPHQPPYLVGNLCTGEGQIDGKLLLNNNKLTSVPASCR